MLGKGPRNERESEIASKSYDAGYSAGRMQQGVQDSEIAQKLYRELAGIHILIDWQDDDKNKARIGALLELARGECGQE